MIVVFQRDRRLGEADARVHRAEGLGLKSAKALVGARMEHWNPSHVDMGTAG